MTQKSKMIALTFSAALFFSIASCVLVAAADADAERFALSQCIAKTATYQKYSGNIYGPEAWELFIGECN